MIETIIPFKVNLLPLPDNVTFRSGYGNVNQRALEDKLFGKVWLVVGIRTNTRIEPYFTCYTHPFIDPLSCNLFLLIREGETPAWWPEIYCEVVETPKEK